MAKKAQPVAPRGVAMHLARPSAAVVGKARRAGARRAAAEGVPQAKCMAGKGLARHYKAGRKHNNVKQRTAEAVRTAGAKEYPPGYFSEPVRAWASMRFESALVLDPATRQLQLRMQAQATAQRAEQQATGKGWGNGTLWMPGTPKTARPGVVPFMR